MRKYCPENERIKREYFAYLKEAKRYSEPTVDAVAKALHRFEEYTGYKDFKLSARNRRSHSKSTLLSKRLSSQAKD